MDAREWGPVDRPFRTDATGSADWITFIEPDDRRGDADRFHHIGPELALKARDLQVDNPQQEIDLTLTLENEATGDTLDLQGPRLRVPERVWAMTPPGFQELGLADTLNPYQEGGLFDVLGRAWKYRQCIEERRVAKRSLGPYTGAGGRRVARRSEQRLVSPSPLAGEGRGEGEAGRGSPPLPNPLPRRGEGTWCRGG